MAALILLVIVVAIVLWMIGAYNRLISLKNQVANAWKQIDVQLKRRHDLIPNLVNTVKGAMNFERTTLEAVISARNKAVSATGVQQTAQAEGELTQALGRLFALTEAYPDLKATGNVAQLQEELTSTENKIGFARQLYNDTATQYNTAQATFPTVLVAGMAKAAPAELWEMQEASERAVPNVDLSMGNQPVSETANLFAQQEANRRRSTWLVVGFILFFAWVGFGGDLAFGLLTADAPPALVSSRRSLHRHRHHDRRRRDLLVLLALRRPAGALVHRRARSGRAGNRGGAAARQRGRGDGDRLGPAEAAGLDRAGRRSQRVRHRARRARPPASP